MLADARRSATGCWSSSRSPTWARCWRRRPPPRPCTPASALRRYMVALLERTRADPRTELGASPRAGLMLLKAAKAFAALDGRDHALPDDVQALAPAVLTHRLLLAPERRRRQRRGGRAGRARARPGAVRTRAPDAPSAAPSSARRCCLAARPSTRRRCYVPGVALDRCSRSWRVAWVRARGARRARSSASPGRTRVEEEPWPLRLQLRRGLLPPPGGELLEPLLGWPVPIGGRWRAGGADRGPLLAPRPAPARARAAASMRDPLGLCDARAWAPAAERAARAAADRAGRRAGRRRRRRRGRAAGRPAPAAAAARRARGRAGARLPAALPRGRPGIAHPLADGGAHRRDDGAPARGRRSTRRRWWCSIARAGRARRSSTRPCGRPPRCAWRWPARRLRAAAAGRPPAGEVGPDLRAWPAEHVRLALVEATQRPPADPRGTARRRGLLGDRALAARRARFVRVAAPASRWVVSPGRRARRRAAFTVAGCTGIQVVRARAAGGRVRRPRSAIAPPELPPPAIGGCRAASRWRTPTARCGSRRSRRSRPSRRALGGARRGPADRPDGARGAWRSAVGAGGARAARPAPLPRLAAAARRAGGVAALALVGDGPPGAAAAARRLGRARRQPRPRARGRREHRLALRRPR